MANIGKFMISEVSISGFKSVEELTIGLGRVNVLVGENGSGKSNILEGIALLAAGMVDKLDNEFLVSRGMRPIEPGLLLPAFANTSASSQKKKSKRTIRLGVKSAETAPLQINLSPESGKLIASLETPRFAFSETTETKLVSHDKKSAASSNVPKIEDPESLLRLLKPTISRTEGGLNVTFGPVTTANEVPEGVIKAAKEKLTEGLRLAMRRAWCETTDDILHLSPFLIYSPENTALRRFEEEGQIQPIGIRGEGLFKLLQSFGKNEASQLNELKHSLELIGWFLDFSIPSTLAPGEYRLVIQDRFLSSGASLDQRAANEGFLFLLFYFAIFLSPDTPGFFAIDNIDAALNPKLCAELMRKLCELAKKRNKQVIFTTHNPAILDGLNLADDDQRLFTVFRDKEGRTKVRRIPPPHVRPGDIPVKLSDAFTRGLIGGLPKNF